MARFELFLLIFETIIGYMMAISVGDFCMIEHFNPKCGIDEVIIMHEAKFGRMQLSRCLYEDRGELGCHDNVIEEFDNQCFGKQSCDIQVGANDMGSRSTCSRSLIQYLEASYSCRKALRVSHAQCLGEEPIALNEKATIITNNFMAQNCISSNQPFSVLAKPGQVLNISLLDFNHEQNLISYGKLKDVANGVEVILQRGSRQQHVMKTLGHQIDITFYTASKAFAIDIAVIGCSDISPPPGAWMTRDGDITELGCHSGKLTWTLECVDNQWVGAVGNCGEGEHEAIEVPEPPKHDQQKVSNNIIVFGVCSIILFMSSIIFLFGVLCLRRHNEYKEPTYMYHPATQVKDLMTFDSASVDMHGSVIRTLPEHSSRMAISQDYKSLQN